MISRELRVSVWRGKYVTLDIASHNHYLKPDCTLNISVPEFCGKVVWIVSYHVYDKTVRLRAAREWFGLKDGTVVHLWTNIDAPQLSLWCYEHYDLDSVVASIDMRIDEDRESGLRLTEVSHAGRLPNEVKQLLWKLMETGKIRLHETKISTWCPERRE